LKDDLTVSAIGAPGLAGELVDPVILIDSPQVPLLLPGAFRGGGRFDGVEAGRIRIGEPEVDLASGYLREPADTPTEGGLAAPGLAHEAHRLSRTNVEGDSVDSPYMPDHPLQSTFLDRKVLLDSSQ
jgi:hypothetical protein